MDHNEILKFWFDELSPAQHFAKDPELDQLISSRFGAIHSSCAAGEMTDWRESVTGALAEIIVLDQFSRNIYRDTPQAFAYDGMALILAQSATNHYLQNSLSNVETAFIYMPFMHSESLVIQDKSVALFSQPGLERNHEFAIQHRDIIAKFGRFPHRNKILNRASTAEEITFLRQPNSKF